MHNSNTLIKNISAFFLAFAIAVLATIDVSKADWRKDIGVFRIGIITSDKSQEALDRLAPFKLAISEALDIEVDFFRARNATTLINALADERIEYAIFSASSYALAWVSCECIEPVAVPRSNDSTDGYHTILISAPDGPKSLEEVKGNSIGVLSDSSITGIALVKHVLGEKNIIIGDEQTPTTKKETADQTLEAFLEGEFKLLIGWSSMTGDPAVGYSRGNLRQLSNKLSSSVRNYKVIWKSDQIPHRPHVMRKKLHGDAKKILRNTLLAMNEKDPVAYDSIEPVYGGGFVAGRHERFTQLISLIKSLDAQPKTAEENLPLQ
jgi:phosphonate transport system substrate-binding protein